MFHRDPRPIAETVTLSRGRFAPSPTGLLHSGSLTTAVGSYLEARVKGGEWLVRIEDIDPGREIPGAADTILRTLERLGFEWDGEVVYQSRRHALYRAAFDRLRRHGYLYPCRCSRRDVQHMAQRGVDGFVYPGTCRTATKPQQEPVAWRLAIQMEGPVGINDRLQGDYAQYLERDVGDIVLLRADGVWAYQFAVVVDDAEQGVTDIVRGADLLVSTPRQIGLQRYLQVPTPSYCHLPVMVNNQGEKLSKQTLAPAINTGEAVKELSLALARLGHPPPAITSIPDLWRWAHAHWSLAKVPSGPVVIEKLI